MESMPKDRQASHNPTMQARELALQAVYGVLENGAYSNLILDKLLKKNTLSPGDNKLVTEIVNGTIRMLKHLDWVLNLFVHKPVGGQNPWLRNILRTSLYQIMFMDRIPNYACVNDAVDYAAKRPAPVCPKLPTGS
jgi:16S rRNA (cytosine967-C5)-methyltransferase